MNFFKTITNTAKAAFEAGRNELSSDPVIREYKSRAQKKSMDALNAGIKAARTTEEKIAALATKYEYW